MTLLKTNFNFDSDFSNYDRTILFKRLSGNDVPGFGDPTRLEEARFARAGFRVLGQNLFPTSRSNGGRRGYEQGGCHRK